jgi:tRNA-binding protein
MKEITFDEFNKVDIRAGTIVKAEKFDRASKPAYKVWVDFGFDIGVRQTSAQITVNYNTAQLVGMKVVGCVNLGDKNIAGFMSQFLLLGFNDIKGSISLIKADSKVPDGAKMM